jgi:hypothetical protein
MGGSGVWTMLSHYPDRFAAAQVWSGRTDYYFWHAEKFERALVSKETMPFYKRVLINADNPYDLAATLKDIPIKTFHAEDDQLIKPGHSSRIFSLLSPPKGKMQLIKIPPNNGGHWFFQYQLGDPEAYRWMLNHKIESPDVIEHICYSPKYGKKHWLSIESMIKPNVPAHVKARIDREKKTVVIETADNIFSLFFHNRIMLTLDNFKIVLSPDAAENRTRQLVLLDMATGTLAIIKNEKKPDAKARAPKFALQSGSVKEAFNHPFMLVVGTGGSEQEKETNLGNADRFIADWKVFAHAMPRVKNDSEITNADEKAFNLILFGSPESNSCLARYSAALPYKFLKTGYQIGENKVEGDGLGFCGIYPNPNNGARAVVIIDGLYYGQSLSFNHKWDLVPDFIIFDSRIDEYDGTNTARLAGFFDSSWQVSPELIYKPED